jgi:cell division septum initiation protein DivIVA
MDILRLLEDLKNLIEEPKSFGPVTWGLDKEEINMQIAKIRASLPQELKAAVSTVRESERIIDTAREDATMTLENARKEAERITAEAKTDADRILEQARLQQERMVADSEILKLSKAQSEEIRNAADRDAVQMRRGAEKYAYDVLSQLEGVVGKVMTTIERGKSEMGRQEAVNNNAALTPAERIARDKARV